MSRLTSLFLVSFLLSLPGCSDDTQPNLDHGAADGPAQKDGGTDGPIKSDGKTPDVKVTLDQQAVDQKNVPGPDVTTDLKITPDMPIPPAKDLKPFTLHSSFKVLYRVPEPASAGAASAMNLVGTDLYLLLPATPFTLKVKTATLDPKTGKLGALSTVFDTSPTLPAGESGYTGGYLALSPKKFAAVGYTTSKTFTGQVIWGDKGIKTPKTVAKASGNFDVLFLDDKTLLVNGTGLGAAQSGQGVYLYQEGKTPRLLIKDLGSASGHMAMGTNTLFAGGYFATTFSNKVFGFSLAEVKAAVAGGKTLSASTDGDLVHGASVGDLATIEDDLIAINLDSSWKYKNVSLYPISVTGDKVTVGSSVTLIGGGSTSTITKLAGKGTKQLALYVKNGSTNEIAVIHKAKALPTPISLSPFTLDNSFYVERRFADPVASGASAMNLAGSDLYLYEAGGTTFAATVSVATISAATGKPGALSTVFSATPTLPTGESAFAGGYLALSAKGFAAVGYSTSKTFTGEVIWGDKGIKTPKTVAKASGNFDVLFLDDKTLLVNGTGLGAAQSGQGVYLYEEGKTPRRLIKDLGSASGYLAMGATTLYAGGYFSATFKSQLFGFSLAEVKAAVTGGKTLSASTDGDLIYDGSIMDAATLKDDLVIITLDSSWKYKEVARIPVTVAGNKLTKGAAVGLISGGAGSTITKLAGEGTTGLGVYLSGASSKEIAIIQTK